MDANAFSAKDESTNPSNGWRAPELNDDDLEYSTDVGNAVAVWVFKNFIPPILVDERVKGLLYEHIVSVVQDLMLDDPRWEVHATRRSRLEDKKEG